MHKTEDKHLFAVYVGHLFAQQKHGAGSSVIIDDEEIVHRVIVVLRMSIGQELLFFDDENQYQCAIIEIKKAKAFTVKINSITQNLKPKREINFVLPLLKKEALEDAVYSLSEIGVTTISLVITAKSQKDLTDKEFMRLHKVKIAAAEQSKNMNIPLITKPVALERFCNGLDTNGPAVLFDPTGLAVFELISQLHVQQPAKISAAIGPEGGFTSAEIKLLEHHGFTKYKLTPTVLRAVQAAAVGAGLLASAL